MQWNARLIAYDCLDAVEWTIKVWDSDSFDGFEHTQHVYLTGAMPGQGSDNPTKWLRALLEEMREAL